MGTLLISACIVIAFLGPTYLLFYGLHLLRQYVDARCNDLDYRLTALESREDTEIDDEELVSNEGHIQ